MERTDEKRVENTQTDTKVCEECGGKMLWCDKHKIFHHEDSYQEECREYDGTLTWTE